MDTFGLSEVDGRRKTSQFTPVAIRHLPASRQRRYVRLAVLGALRDADRDLSVMEVHERTELDPRTIRSELARLVSTREVERIPRRAVPSYRPIGHPMHFFGKRLVILMGGAYTFEPIRTARGKDLLVVQERMETLDGSYEPVGGIAVAKEDLSAFMESLEAHREESFDLRRKSQEG